MEHTTLLGCCDYTLLKAYATWEQIQKVCQDAIAYKTATVCIPPCYVKRIRQTYKEALKICTVIGFPLGYNTTEIKVAEAKQAVAEGADEVDMVVNICDVKNGDYQKVTEEIREIKHAIGSKTLKVIIEACYMDEEEKICLCHCVQEAGADYIKTSTGFGTGGATLEDVRLMRENLDPRVKIKAAGGIRTVADHQAFLEEGCQRLGTSSIIGLIEASL